MSEMEMVWLLKSGDEVGCGLLVVPVTSHYVGRKIGAGVEKLCRVEKLDEGLWMVSSDNEEGMTQYEEGLTLKITRIYRKLRSWCEERD